MSIKSNISIANHKYIKKYYSIIALTLVAVILITINLLSSANSVNDNEVVTQDNLKTDNNSLKDLLTSIVGNIESQENIQDIKTNNQPVNNTNNTSNQSILSKSYFPENQYNDSIQVRAKSDMLIYQNNKQESDTNNTKVNIIKTNKLDNLESKILQGKIISAILETEINSDLPGMIRAVINDNVYSESNDNILIPKGSRLIGKYNSDIVMNQSRVFIEWNRLITPNGVDIEFLSPGVDAQGQAGLTGEINNHHAFRFSQAMLSSLINITAIPKANKEDTKKIEIYKKALLENINNNAQEVIKDNIDIKPTINIKAGTIVNVFVAKDIEFNNEDI
mgnify:CR=1 FL=1